MAENKTVYQFAVTHAAGVGAVGVVEGSFYIEVDGNTANIGVCGDLPWNFHPVVSRALGEFTPCGAV